MKILRAALVAFTLLAPATIFAADSAPVSGFHAVVTGQTLLRFQIQKPAGDNVFTPLGVEWTYYVYASTDGSGPPLGSITVAANGTVGPFVPN